MLTGGTVRADVPSHRQRRHGCRQWYRCWHLWAAQCHRAALQGHYLMLDLRKGEIGVEVERLEGPRRGLR